MPEPIISPDGNFVLINGEWVRLAQQQVNLSDSVIAGDLSLQSTVNINTRAPEDEITNLAEVAIFKLENGDMAAVKDLFHDAKKIDLSIAQRVFEKEFSVRIGSGYVNITEIFAKQIVATRVTVSGQSFGVAGTLWDVKGNHELSAMISQQNIALNNALSFLGIPSEYANSSGFELALIEDECFEQLYKLGHLCIYSGNSVLFQTNYAHVHTDGVTLQFINDLRLEAIQLSTFGTMMIADLRGIDVKSRKFQMPNWQAKYSSLVMNAETSGDWAMHLERERGKKNHQQKIWESAQNQQAIASIVLTVVIILVVLFFN